MILVQILRIIGNAPKLKGPAQTLKRKTMSIHSEQSSYREKLLEHLFVGEVLRYLWCQELAGAEFLRPEVDNGGYDLVVSLNKIIRHVQLKTSFIGATTESQKVHMRLAEKPSGCVVWIMFEALGPFLWYGGEPGAPLPDIASFPVAKHTKPSSDGIKAERPNVRVIGKARFEEMASISQLVEKLFGPVQAPNVAL